MADNPTILIEPENSPSHVVVNVYLRGGADGLHLVPPVGDDDYQKSRPTLALSEKNSLPLQGIFRLNSALAPLHPLFESGELAIVHQAGTEESSRSHFEAEDYLHYGSKSGGGWLGRFLHLTKKSNAGPLMAVSIGERISDSLHGAAAVSMRHLEEFALPKDSDGWQGQMAKLYANTPGALGKSGQETLDAMKRIRKLTEQTRAENEKKGKQATDDFKDGLELVARLIQADLGMRAATIELGGWDSHFGAQALLSGLMPRLANGLANFHQKLGGDVKRVTVVVLTEFGRRVGENASLGTDHGRGGVHWVLGGGVKGGKVYEKWSGLASSLLEYPGDVPVVNDYRSTLGSVCQHVEPGIDAAKLFPGYEGALLPLYG